MKFDTEEAFFTAVYRKAGIAPCNVGRMVEGGSDPKAVITAAVNLMRAAFEVHQRAASQIGPGDDLLGFRMAQAAEKLPDDWQIVVLAKRGEIAVDLYGPGDQRFEVPRYNESPSGLVTAAIDEALKEASNG